MRGKGRVIAFGKAGDQKARRCLAFSELGEEVAKLARRHLANLRIEAVESSAVFEVAEAQAHQPLGGKVGTKTLKQPLSIGGTVFAALLKLEDETTDGPVPHDMKLIHDLGRAAKSSAVNVTDGGKQVGVVHGFLAARIEELVAAEGLPRPVGMLIGEALLAVGSGHFQSVTVCHGFIPLVGQALFRDAPIDLRIVAAGQDGDDIDDGEIPLLLDLVPGAADLFFFKEGKGAHLEGAKENQGSGPNRTASDFAECLGGRQTWSFTRVFEHACFLMNTIILREVHAWNHTAMTRT